MILAPNCRGAQGVKQTLCHRKPRGGQALQEPQRKRSGDLRGERPFQEHPQEKERDLRQNLPNIKKLDGKN